MKLFHTALVLGKGGFGTQLGEMLAEAGGYLESSDEYANSGRRLFPYFVPG